MVENNHPAIISKALFLKARQKIQDTKREKEELIIENNHRIDLDEEAEK